MEDSKIIDLYWNRNEQAIAQTRQAYGDYCRSVAANILHSPEDIEEVLADTWLKAWNAIPPQRPVHLKLFLAKITRNLAFSRYRSQGARMRGGNAATVALDELGECVSGGQTPEEALDAGLLKEAIEAFLHTLPARHRMIFVRRYFFLEETDTIARRYALTETNVRMILSRTRKKLKQHLIQEGYEL